ncbi:MAG: DUF3168 domain-containing protein [Proteobacteria bacterium]|nr:DUF3168 domain-containing protein [Pseudomonadota bacterium]NDG19948.1 DUF3168 domain-containing protein [Betaproteobacteria bacterium]
MIASPEKHVLQRLVTNPGVARLVGFQVFAIAVPKTATLPFVIYKRAGIARESYLAGPLYVPVVTLQVASWAMNYDTARELADQVRLALDGHTGTVAGVTIDDMRLVSEVDDFIDPTAVGAQLPPAYEVRQAYQIRWQEATE